MRRRFLIATLAWALAAPATARAQAMDGGAIAAAGFASPAALQQLLLLQLYGMQAQQMAAMSPADEEAFAKRAAQYFTNGAEATAVPTSGPAAAYFHNGAEVTAASTTDTVAFGASAFPSPELATDASEGLGALALDASARQAAAPAAPATAAGAEARLVQAGSAASAEPVPRESAAAPPPPGRETPAGVDTSARAAAPAPATALADITTRSPDFPTGGDANRYAHQMMGWAAALVGALGMGALILFLAMRLRARGDPTI